MKNSCDNHDDRLATHHPRHGDSGGYDADVCCECANCDGSCGALEEDLHHVTEAEVRAT